MSVNRTIGPLVMIFNCLPCQFKFPFKIHFIIMYELANLCHRLISILFKLLPFPVAVSPGMANPTLQSLLATPATLQNGQFLNTDGIQILTIQSSATDLIPANIDASGKIWHVINPATLIAVDDPTEFKPVSIIAGKLCMKKSNECVSIYCYYTPGLGSI